MDVTENIHTDAIRVGLACRPSRVDDVVRVGDVDGQVLADELQLGVLPAGAASHALPEGDDVQAEPVDELRLSRDLGGAGTVGDALAETLSEDAGIDDAVRDQSRPSSTRRRATARSTSHELINRRGRVERRASAVPLWVGEHVVLRAELVDGADGDPQSRRHLHAVEEVGFAHVHEYNLHADTGRHAASCSGIGTQFRNLVPMTPTNVNEIRQELQAVAVELAKQKEVIDRRDELIELARSQTPPMTLREVAQLLKMTERGVTKALSSYRERHQSLAS